MIKQCIMATVFLACLFAVWMYSERKGAQAVRPPAAGTNLLGFLELRPLTNQIRKFVHHGKPFLQVMGKVNWAPLALRSGPPAYIFDETGRFVDWCGDIGDNNVFVRKWGGFSNATPISAAEAIKLVRTPPQ